MTTPLDTTTPLAALLLTSPAGHTGTFSDMHEDTKMDREEDEDGNPVDPVDASDVPTKFGAVWGGSVDALWLSTYQQLHLGAKVWTRADATAREALGSDNALAAEDLCFQQDDRTLWACDSVDGGAASTWSALSATGDMVGPASSTDEAIARFNGAGGKTLQNSTATLTDGGALSVASITVSGLVDGVDVAALSAAEAAHEADVANPHDVILAQVLTSDGSTGGAGDGITIDAADFLTVEAGADFETSAAIRLRMIGGRDGDPQLTTKSGVTEDLKIKPALPVADDDAGHLILEGADAAAGVGTPDGGSVKIRAGLGDGGGVNGQLEIECGVFMNNAAGINMDGNPITGLLTVGLVDGVRVGDTAALGATIFSGVGAPGAIGANGDLYIRTDGGALTTIYYRSGGTWAGIL